MTELKRILTVGAEFEIIDHCRPETIGEVRRINYANTQGFYTTIPADPDGRISRANGGEVLEIQREQYRRPVFRRGGTDPRYAHYRISGA
jgi:hypothetical protein